MQSNFFQRKCLDHNNKQILLVCYNKFCKENRLVCQKCNVLHSAHLEELIDNDQIDEKVQYYNSKGQQFIKSLNDSFDELTYLLRKLIQSIQIKFYISIEKMNGMDDQQLNQYLNQLIIQDEQPQTQSEVLKNGCQYLKDKIVQCQNEIGLKELNSIQLTKEIMQTAEIFYKQGKAYYDKKDHANAIKQFDIALDLNINHLLSLQFKGDSLRLLGQNIQSIEWYEKALQIDPKHVDALFGKGESLYSLSQYEESIEQFDKVLQIDPKYVYVLYKKGESLRILDQYKESIEWFDKAIKIDSQYLYALNSKGESLRMLGLYKKSIEWFDKALQIDPKYVNALFGKGEALRMLSQYTQALEFLDSALSIDTNFEPALGSKGACLIEFNRLDEAEVCLNKAIKLNPKKSFNKNQQKKLQDKRKQ